MESCIHLLLFGTGFMCTAGTSSHSLHRTLPITIHQLHSSGPSCEYFCCCLKPVLCVLLLTNHLYILVPARLRYLICIIHILVLFGANLHYIWCKYYIISICFLLFQTRFMSTAAACSHIV